MTSPLERAARALCELDGHPPGATMNGNPLWKDYLPEARAVLQAIREPSEAMIEWMDDCDWTGYEDPDMADAWRRGIDVALREGA